MLDPSQAPGEEALATLPVFPLPNAVMLPGMVLPLHVFEPRYLDLVDHVLEGHGYIGVPQLVDSSREPPTFEPTFGVGKLTSHATLPDGRRLIRLAGLGRVRAVRELPQVHTFRRVEVRALPETQPSDAHLLAILHAQVERVAKCFGDDEQNLVRAVLELEDPRVMIYAIAALIPSVESVGGVRAKGRPMQLQQACMDADEADARVELLLGRLAELIDVLGLDRGSGSTTLN